MIKCVLRSLWRAPRARVWNYKLVRRNLITSEFLATVKTCFGKPGGVRFGEDLFRALDEFQRSENIVVGAMLKLYGAEGKWKAQEDLFEQGNKLDEQTFAVLVGQCATFAGQGGARRAKQLLARAESQGIAPSIVIGERLFHVFASEGLWEELDRVYEDHRHEMKRRQFNILLNSCNRRPNRVAHARRLLEDMKANRLEPDSGTVNALIRLYRGAPKEQNMLLQRYKSLLDNRSFSILLRSLKDTSGGAERANDALTKMAELKIEVNTIHFNCALDVFAAGRRWDLQDALLGKFAHLADLMSLNKLLESCLECPDKTRPEKLLKRLGHISPDADTMMYMLSLNDDSPPKQQYILSKFRSMGIRPTLHTARDVLRQPTKVTPERAKFLKAILADLVRNDPTLDTRAVQLELCVKEGDLKTATALMKELEETESEWDQDIVVAVVDLLGAKGMLDEALECFHRLKMTVVRKELCYNRLLKHCIGHTDSVERAEAILKMMAQDGFKADQFVVTKMLEIYGAAGRFAEQIQMLQRFRAVEISGRQFTKVLQSAALSPVSHEERVAQVEVLFEDMKRRAIDVDGPLLRVLLDLFADNWQKQDALLKEFAHVGLEVSCFNILLKHCMAQGAEGMARATALCKDMQQRQVEPDEVTLNTMLDIYGTENMIDAQKTMARMFSHLLNQESFNILLKHCVYQANGEEEANNILSEMKARGIQLDLISVNTLLDLHGKSWSTQDALFQYCGENADHVTFATLVKHCRGVPGGVERAERYLQEMRERNIPSDSVMLNTLLSVYAHENCWLKHDTLLDQPEADEISFAVALSSCPQRADGKAKARELLKKMEDAGYSTTAEIRAFVKQI